jgi:hypothetical protein
MFRIELKFTKKDFFKRVKNTSSEHPTSELSKNNFHVPFSSSMNGVMERRKRSDARR